MVLVVTAIPSKRQELQANAGLSLALLRGVSRMDVTSGRLFRSGCYFDHGHDARVGRRFGFTLLPEGIKVERGEILEVAAEEADGTDGPFARFFGRYVKNYKPNQADFFSDKIFGNAFRCGPISTSGEMRVAVISAVHYWDYDLAKAEESRNIGIQDEELLKGRIVIGECSPGVDSWAIWKVRVPDSLNIEIGDYIEATAGSYEGSTSVGPISKALRKVAKPHQADFVRTQGKDTVSCSAHPGTLPEND